MCIRDRYQWVSVYYAESISMTMCNLCNNRGGCWNFHVNAETTGPLVSNAFYMPAQAGKYVEFGREQKVVNQRRVRGRDEDDWVENELRVEVETEDDQQGGSGALMSPRKRRRSFRKKQEAKNTDTVSVEEEEQEDNLSERSEPPRRGQVAKK